MQSNEPNLQAPSFSYFLLFEPVFQQLVPKKKYYDESLDQI